MYGFDMLYMYLVIYYKSRAIINIRGVNNDVRRGGIIACQEKQEKRNPKNPQTTTCYQ